MVLGSAFHDKQVKRIDPNRSLGTPGKGSKVSILSSFSKTTINKVNPKDGKIPDKTVYNVSKIKRVPACFKSFVLVEPKATEAYVLDPCRTDRFKMAMLFSNGILEVILS